MSGETLRMKNDSALRKRLFAPEAMAHPAKGHISMWQEMIERYTKPGDLVLDPMAGIGTSLVAAMMGRNVVCVELEPHFVEPMRASWSKIQEQPMLGHAMGWAFILHGDARALPLGSADVVLTSPPYANRLSDTYVDGDPGRMSYAAGKAAIADAVVTSPPYEGTPDSHGSGITIDGSLSPEWHPGPNSQVNRPQGYASPSTIAAVLTSPPFQDVEPAKDQEWLEKHGKEFGGGTGPSMRSHYTRPKVDAVVSSPPFGEAQSGGGIAVNGYGEHDPGMAQRVYSDAAHNHSAVNIGNQRGDAYWESMRQVYAECWRVLRPGGLLVLVLKGFTRDGQYVDLPGQTEALLLAAGWEKHDHWRRELWSLSFWRILQKRRDPAAFDARLNYEEVLCFRKPTGSGDGVAAVLTSPPYEASLHEGQGGPGATSDAHAWTEDRERTRGSYTGR